MSRKKTLAQIGILILGTVVIEFAFSWLSPPARPLLPDEVVASYLDYSQQGDTEKIKAIATTTPKSYDDYLRQLALESRYSFPQEYAPVNVAIPTGSGTVELVPKSVESIPNDALTTSQLLTQDWPRAFHSKNLVVFGKPRTWIKGNDAKVRVAFGLKGASRGFEWHFFLHREEQGWKIFRIDWANYSDKFPT
jgi:hypothetical protein